LIQNRRTKKLLILDRDGTLIQHVHHLIDPKLVKLQPGVINCLRQLKKLNFEFAIATNQSVISRGMATDEVVNEINEKVVKILTSSDIKISAIQICPHSEEDSCDCRKPKTGMGKRIMSQLGYSSEETLMIGDQPSDIEFAYNLGAKSIYLNESKYTGIFPTFECQSWDKVYLIVNQIYS